MDRRGEGDMKTEAETRDVTTSQRTPTATRSYMDSPLESQEVDNALSHSILIWTSDFQN